MKKIHLLAGLALIAGMSFTSCKKDYTCTCTTTVGGISSTKTHELNNQNLNDATEACDRFENDANSTGIGTTNCNL